MKILYFTLAIASVTLHMGASDDFSEIKILPELDIIRTTGKSVTLTCNFETNDISNTMWIGPDTLQIEGGSSPKRAIENAGDGSLVLELKNLSLNDGGLYRCRGFSRFANRTVETTKSVTVYDRVEFFDVSKVQEKLIGTDGSLICNVRGEPPPNVIWLLNGRKIDLDLSEKFFKNGTNLGIRNISKDDEKTYRCKARQPAQGESEVLDIELVVNIPPKIENFTTKFTVIQGEVVEFTCKASGSPEPTYSWYVGDGSGGGQYHDSGSSMSLPISQKMDPAYTCIASNKAGDDRATFTLDVLVRPSFISTVGDSTREGEQASLKCTAEGVPTPDVYIYRDDILLEETTDVESDSENSTYAFGQWSPNRIVTYAQNEATVSFLDTAYTDDGKYQCRANNSAGVDFAEVLLEVKYSPRKKNLANTWVCRGDIAQLDCEFDGNPTPKLAWGQYIPVEGSEDDENGTTNYSAFNASDLPAGVEIINTSNTLSLIIDGSIVEDIFGTYVCSAENSVGFSEANAMIKKAVRPRPPFNIQLFNITTSGVTITFDPREPPLVPYTSFVVSLVSQAANSTSVVLGPEETEVTFNNLTHDASYVVVIEANNCAGTSDASEELSFTTVAIVSPESAEIISGKVSEDHDKYTVQWKPGDMGGGTIKKIEITLFEVKVDVDGNNLTKVETKEVLGDRTGENGSFVIEGLNPATDYEISVAIYNEVGFATSMQRFRTNLKSLHDDPMDVTDDELPFLETTTESVSTGAEIDLASTDRQLIIIIVVVLLVLILVVDITCCVTRNCGLTYWIYAHTCGKGKQHNMEDAEEGSAQYRQEHKGNYKRASKLDPIDEQTPLQTEGGVVGPQAGATGNGTTDGAKESKEETAEEKNDHTTQEQEKLVQSSSEPTA